MLIIFFSIFLEYWTHSLQYYLSFSLPKVLLFNYGVIGVKFFFFCYENMGGRKTKVSAASYKVNKLKGHKTYKISAFLCYEGHL